MDDLHNTVGANKMYNILVTARIQFSKKRYRSSDVQINDLPTLHLDTN